MKHRVLNYININGYTKIKDISTKLKISVGSTSNIITDLIKDNFISDKKEITDKGIDFLQQSQVKKAIIIACEPGIKLWPLTDSIPKSLILVNGKVLIETVIESLINSNIMDITIIVGKFKKQYEYLNNKYSLKILYNEYWNDLGTMSYLYPIINEVNVNTVIVEGDLLIRDEFIFDKFISNSYMAGSYIKGKTSEYCFVLQGKDIINIKSGGIDQFGWKGIFYLSSDYYDEYKEYILKNVFEPNHINDDYAKVLINISRKHKRGLHMKEIHSNDVIEIDRWVELEEIDKSYKKNKLR